MIAKMPAAPSRTKVFTLELLVKDQGRFLKFDHPEQLWDHTNIRELREDDTFEEVVFSDTSLGPDACEYIGKLLAKQKNLRSANFSDMFTTRSPAEIPKALNYLLKPIYNLPGLNTVDFSANALGIEVYVPLVEFLAAHAPLQHLYLKNNGISAECGILIAEALCKLYDAKQEARTKGMEVPDLETVVCARNRLETGSMDAWAKVFSKHNKIKVVKLFGSHIGAGGFSHLFREGLAKATELEVLNLYDSNLGHSGGAALAKAIGAWPELRKLNLNSCLLSEKSGELLAAALKDGNNKKLKALRLKNNSITPTSLAILTDAAEQALPNLKRLCLDENDFEEDDPSLLRLKRMFKSRNEKHGWQDMTGKEDADEDEDEEDEYHDKDPRADDTEAEDDTDEEPEESDEQAPTSKKTRRRNAWGLDKLEGLAGAGSSSEDEEDIKEAVESETRDFNKRVRAAREGVVTSKASATASAKEEARKKADELKLALDKIKEKKLEQMEAVSAAARAKNVEEGVVPVAGEAEKETKEEQKDEEHEEDKDVKELTDKLAKLGTWE